MSKGKRYCSIQKWIEENDKKLFDFLEDNCLLGIFKFRHGTSGVTFLHPKNWKDIEKAIESGDYVDGVNTLKAHVLQGYYPNLDGLMEQHDGLVNALGQLVEVDKKAGNVVVLKNKAKVSESKFQGTPDRTNINVFHYDGDLLPTNAPAGSLKYTSAPSGKKSKSGGGFSGMNKHSKTKMVEQCAVNLIRQGKYASHNPYAAAVVSLYAFASDAERAALAPLLDVFPEHAFYGIFVPYGPCDQDALIDRWLSSTGGMYTGSNPCAEYLKVLKHAKVGSGEAVQGVAAKADRLPTVVKGRYAGKPGKQIGDEMRWFIALRRSEDPNLFSDVHKFITLVYDLAILFNGNSSIWLADATGYGSLFSMSRYFCYDGLKSVSGAMSPAEAASKSLNDIGNEALVIALDEARQLSDLEGIASQVDSSDDMSERYKNAAAAMEAFKAIAV